MKPARSLMVRLLAAMAVVVSYNLSYAQGPGPLADPKSENQAGFPATLYSWVIPPDNQQTPAKIALGKSLFFDDRLSADGKISCDHCHSPGKGFTDQLPTSMGIHAQFGQRNAPSVLNALFNVTQFWDGRSPTLEAQVEGPVTNPVEMGMKSTDDAVAAIKAIPEYQKQFQTVFGHDVNFTDLERAIAAYERTQLAFDSPFDKFMAGDHSRDKRFGQAWMVDFQRQGPLPVVPRMEPHPAAVHRLQQFHNIGVSAHKSDFVPLARKALDTLAPRGASSQQIDKLAIGTDMSGLGRFLVTKQPHDIGGFRTLGLRNLLVTQPYFHDGSQVTLWDTIDHYNKGGVQNPYLDGGIVPLGLTEPED